MPMIKLEHIERSRTYFYSDGTSKIYCNVIAIEVTKSGFHKLETQDGMKYIIAPGWRSIDLDTDSWTF